MRAISYPFLITLDKGVCNGPISLLWLGEGVKGLLKDGGSGRVAAVKKLLESVGGTLECFYWAFGHYDYFLIADVRGNVSAAGEHNQV